MPSARRLTIIVRRRGRRSNLICVSLGSSFGPLGACTAERYTNPDNEVLIVRSPVHHLPQQGDRASAASRRSQLPVPRIRYSPSERRQAAKEQQMKYTSPSTARETGGFGLPEHVAALEERYRLLFESSSDAIFL